MELGEAAQAVAAALGDTVPVDRAAITIDRVDRYVGDGSIYDQLRAERGIAAVPFPDQVRETADYLVAAQRSGE